MKCRFSPVFSFLSAQLSLGAHLTDAHPFDAHLPPTRHPVPFHMLLFPHYCPFIVPSQPLYLFIPIIISQLIVTCSRLVYCFLLTSYWYPLATIVSYCLSRSP